MWKKVYLSFLPNAIKLYTVTESGNLSFCRISEASKAFQMEKIEHDYGNMNHFTVNLNREEKIIREIDFYRGVLFLWPFAQNCRCVKVAEGFSVRKGGFRIISRMDVDNFTRIIIQHEALFLDRIKQFVDVVYLALPITVLVIIWL